MSKFRRALLAAAAIVGGAALFFAPQAAAYVSKLTAPIPPIAATLDAATLKVVREGGHGSGVHIGNGFVLTAAHVVGDAGSVELKSKDGQSRQADVLWINKAYDIALLRTSSATLAVAHLACKAISTGDSIRAIGNPLNQDFVNAYGKIASEPRETGPWKSVYLTDMVTVMGMSGGPVFSADGELIGITVGVMVAPMGFTGSLAGYGFVVPSRDVCALMARI